MQPSATAERTSLGSIAKRLPQRRNGRIAADASQGHCGGRGYVAIGILQPPDEAIDRPRVAANSQGIDHADQEPAVQLAGSRPQGIVGRAVGNDLQGDACPSGKFRVGKQGRQGRHGFAVANDRQPLAGQGLFGRRRIAAKQVDEFLLFDGDVGLWGICRLGGLFGRIGLRAQGDDKCQEYKGSKVLHDGAPVQ